MRRKTLERGDEDFDEFWILQHYPVYTQGYSCSEMPLRDQGDVTIVSTDRGGQLTYHGPGQLIIYLLLDLKRLHTGARRLVNTVEQAIIEMLDGFGVAGELRSGAPGVYVADCKIASLGFRIVRGCCYHGLSLNVSLDTEPFTRIRICGMDGLEATSMQALGVDCSIDQAAEECVRILVRAFGYLNPLTVRSNG